MAEQKRSKGAAPHKQANRKREAGLPFYPALPEDFLDPKLLIRLSHSRCLQWQCLPVCEDSAGVTIATHAGASLDELNERVGRFFDKRIYWVLCPQSYLTEAIHRAFGFYTR